MAHQTCVSGSADLLSEPILRQSDAQEFLAYYSDRGASWDTRRETADRLSLFFASLADTDDRLSRYAKRIWSCAGRLLFRWENQPDGTSQLRLSSAQFCRVRLCPVCMWRRSLMWFSRFLAILPAILGAYPGARWLHLTLTVKNPDIDDLSSVLDDMNKAWKRLTLRKDFSRYILGWIRSTEVTRGQDGPNRCHPHYHVLLLVSPGYFKGGGYLSHAAWVDLWASALRVDYRPAVRVKAVTARRASNVDVSRYSSPEGVNPDAWAQAIGGGLEVLKYCTKPLDLVPKSGGDPWLVALTYALHRRRLIAAGGVLKLILSDTEKDEDLIHGDDGPAESPDDGGRLAFAVPAVAGAKRRRYKRARQFDVKPR